MLYRKLQFLIENAKFLSPFQDTAYQTFTEWIDEEKVEEFNEFLDNQLQSKLGRGYNSAVGSARASWTTATLSFVIVLLLLYDNRQM